jgi:hypothetical protein
VTHVLSNVLEVKVAVITKDKTSESDQQFGEWWVYVDKILGFDILGREFAKVHLVESGKAVVRMARCSGGMQQFTHTTLLGFESLNKRTAQATITTTTNSFHSPGVIFRPPVG